MHERVIKICGIQSLAEAELCLRAGVNTLGFLVGLTHKAEDKITAEAAASIIAALPANTQTWMVTHLLDATKIAKIANGLGVTGIQIHDDLSDEGVAALAKLCPGIKLIKAVHVMGEEAVSKARHYDAMPEISGLLLDSRTQDRLGGTGLTHDWNISRQIVAACSKPVVLAGGLKPDNMAEAIAQVGPAGVDANSGVEDGTGAKDPEKVAAYAAIPQSIWNNA